MKNNPNTRKIIYAGIYICVAITFPALPLGGLALIGGILKGSVVSTKDHLIDFFKEILFS